MCGNGLVEEGEECDDGNTENLDGCSKSCKTEEGWACQDTPSNCILETTICGNKEIEVGEICDDGNSFNGDGCSGNCLALEAGFECQEESTPTSQSPGEKVFTLCTRPQSIETASTVTKGVVTATSSLLVLQGLSSLQMGPGVWMMINTIQIARISTIISHKQAPLIKSFLLEDLSTFDLNFDFIESGITSAKQWL